MTYDAEPQFLLLVEDNSGDARLIRDALAQANSSEFTFLHVDRLSTALQCLKEKPVAAVLLDLSLPDSQGFDTIKQVQACSPQTPVVVLTGLEDEEVAIAAVQEGAQDYLIKGQVNPRMLMRSLRYAIERQRLRLALRAGEERYRNLFDNASDAILSFTLAGQITNANHALTTMLGWSSEEVIERDYRKILTPTSAAILEERFRLMRVPMGGLSSPLAETVELEAVRSDGGVVPIEIHDDLLRNSQGQVVGVMMMARDISARKNLERQRAEFLAMLTHDIKNPLTALMGYTDYLMEGSRDVAKRGDALNWIKSNAFTILSLVNNYLDLSRIEDKQLALTKTAVSLNDLLSRIARQYEGEARRRQITLRLQLQKQPLWVEGDALALERTFVNLVQNAVKFTPKEGKVTVSSASQRGEVIVTVADTGPGIAAQEIPRLFGKYQRLLDARQKEGWGLGLFIVKTFVEAHDGRVEVESAPGAGTCFRIYLPLKAPEG